MRKDHQSLAQHHVERGRLIVKSQRDLIIRLRACCMDSSSAEGLLVQFEASLALFEQDLDELSRRETPVKTPT